MKKGFVLITVVAVALFAFAACQKKESTAPVQSAPTMSAPTSTAAPMTAPEKK